MIRSNRRNGVARLDICRSLFDGLLDLLFPTACALCGILGHQLICERCSNSLIVSVPPPYCLRCGQVQPGPECVKCNDYPAKLIRCRAVGVHDGDLATLIHQLKYRDRPMLAKPLAEFMATYLEIRAEIMNDLVFDAIIAVPLHRSRQRHRGYNQSERLALALGDRLELPVDRRALYRVQNTAPQVGKQRAERLKNLVGAFAARADLCQGRKFLLVDDVSTTGSTLSECARALLNSGAVEVYAITLAAG